MGAIRTRFTPAERAAFTVGTAVEWLDGTRWKPGTVAGPVETLDGQQVIPVRHEGVSRFVNYGEIVEVYPKHVRLRPQP